MDSDSNILYVTTDDGQEKVMNILFTFGSKEYGKSYVLFYDPDDKDKTVYARAYDEDGNRFAVEAEEEWDMIEEVLESFEHDEEEEHHHH